jgi:hypothetical protein
LKDPTLLQEHGLGLVPFGAQVDGLDRKEHIVEGIVDRPVVGGVVVNGVVVNDQHIGVCQGDRDPNISQKIGIDDLGGWQEPKPIRNGYALLVVGVEGPGGGVYRYIAGGVYTLPEVYIVGTGRLLLKCVEDAYPGSAGKGETGAPTP